MLGQLSTAAFCSVPACMLQKLLACPSIRNAQSPGDKQIDIHLSMLPVRRPHWWRVTRAGRNAPACLSHPCCMQNKLKKDQKSKVNEFRSIAGARVR